MCAVSGILATVADALFPVRCAGCDASGTRLCERCAKTLAGGAFEVRRGVLRDGPPVYALADYTATARTLVLAFKERGRRDLSGPLGQLMASALPRLPGARTDVDGTWWLVPAPSRPRAARARGGSHMMALARSCAAELAAARRPAAVAPALRLAAGAVDSVGLDGPARIANLAGRVRFRPAGAPPARTPVVLLDDVVTTGATAAACVRELRRADLAVRAVLTLTAT